jgi:hypothetical protein
MRATVALKALALDIATTASVNNYGLFINKEKPRTTIMKAERSRHVHQCVIPSLSLLRPFVRHVKITSNYNTIGNYNRRN